MKIICTLIILTILFIPATYADNIEQTSSESQALVGFEVDQPTEPVTPLDPINPKETLNPDLGTGSIGYLTIDYVPDISFGAHIITRKTESIKSTNLKPFVQVTDVRGTGAGWRLQAGLSEFENVEANHTLSNAKVTLIQGKTITNDDLNHDAPTAITDITLVSSEQIQYTDIITAQAENGMGTWLTTWISGSDAVNEKVSLNVDTRDARVGEYGATITWNLVQTP